jgi:hypothetical protein
LITLNVFGKIIDSKPLQLQKANSPIVVTVFGIVIEVRLEQPSNVLDSIFVTLKGTLSSPTANPPAIHPSLNSVTPFFTNNLQFSIAIIS